MKIAAITKFKHGHLWKALQQLDLAASDLARETGLSYSAILRFLSMTARPSIEQVAKLMEFFYKFGVVIDMEEWWPQEFSPLKQSFSLTQVEDIPVELLLPGAAQSALPPSEILMEQERTECLEEAMSDLTSKERAVLHNRFFDDETLDATAQLNGIQRERARQIEAKALRKLRHPTRQRLLVGLLSP